MKNGDSRAAKAANVALMQTCWLSGGGSAKTIRTKRDDNGTTDPGVKNIEDPGITKNTIDPGMKNIEDPGMKNIEDPGMGEGDEIGEKNGDCQKLDVVSSTSLLTSAWKPKKYFLTKDFWSPFVKWGLYREASSEDYGEIFLLNDVNRVVSARCQVSLVTDGDRKGQFMLLVNGIFRQDFGRFLRFMFKTDVVSGFVDKWDKFKLVAKNLRQTLQIQQDIALSKGKSQKSQALPPSKEVVPTFHFTNETSGSDGEFDGNNSDEYQEVGMMGSKGKSNAVFQQGKSGDGHRGPGSVVPGPAQH